MEKDFNDCILVRVLSSYIKVWLPGSLLTAKIVAKRHETDVSHFTQLHDITVMNIFMYTVHLKGYDKLYLSKN